MRDNESALTALSVIEYLVEKLLKSACQEVTGCHGNIFKGKKICLPRS